MKLNIKNISLVLIIFIFGFAIGSGFQGTQGVDKPKDTDFSPLFEVWKNIKNSFYFEGDTSFQDKKDELLYGAIQGMVKTLDDPYTSFLKPQEAKQLTEQLSGSYEGIGARVGIRDEVLTVISPLKGTPADKKGLSPGDKIIKVNGETTKDMSLTEAVANIKGEEGTSVNLTIKRDGKELEVEIVRQKIKIPTLKFKWLGEDNDIAYVKLYNFAENTPSRFREITEKVLNSDTNKIILDVRNNPGGYLPVCEKVANFFIKEGELILKEAKASGEIHKIESKGPGSFADFETAILINKGSASASEILAGSIKEQNGATVIGETSFGKGTVQEVVPLSDDSQLKLTIAHWLLPSGKSINENGITPDKKIKMSKEEELSPKDPQLDKAIEVLERY